MLTSLVLAITLIAMAVIAWFIIAFAHADKE